MPLFEEEWTYRNGERNLTGRSITKRQLIPGNKVEYVELDVDALQEVVFSIKGIGTSFYVGFDPDYNGIKIRVVSSTAQDQVAVLPHGANTVTVVVAGREYE